MKCNLLVLATPLSLSLGVLAMAQQVTAIHAQPPLPVAQGQTGIPGDPWVPIPGLPPAPPPHLNHPDWVPTPGLTPSLPPSTIHGEASSYCLSTLNSSGYAAQMCCSGNLSVCTNNSCVAAIGCPPDNLGLFIYGSNPAQIPLGNGYLCISPYNPGLFRLAPSVLINSSGTAQLKLDLKNLPAAGMITPGSTWHFQCWFRDPLGGGAGYNLSNGLRVTFSG